MKRISSGRGPVHKRSEHHHWESGGSRIGRYLYMSKHPPPPTQRCSISSAFTSCSLDFNFSRASTGNQSAIKFINPKSRLAGGKLVGNQGLVQERNHSHRLAVRTQGDRHIGQSVFPCFCNFTKHLREKVRQSCLTVPSPNSLT